MATGTPQSTTDLKSAIEYHRQGDLDEASRRYQAILDGEPDHADALHLSGVIAYQRGDLKEAEKRIRRALEHHPRSGAYHCSLGNVKRAQDKRDEAHELFKQAVDLDPNLADGYNNLGLLAMEEGDFQGAEQQFKLALVVNQDEPQTLNNMGYALLRQERSADAVSYLMRAVQANPKSPLIQANLGSALCANGTPGLAVKCFENAIDLRPDFDRAHTELGQVLVDLHQPAEARECFSKAIEVRPKNIEARLGLAQLLRDEDPAAAIEELEATLPEAAEDVSVVSELARAYLAAGRLHPAVETTQHWLRLAPDSLDALKLMGDAHLAAGHFEEAKHAWTQAAAIAPEDDEVQALLAQALEHGGHIADSEQAADRALSHNPGRHEALAVKARNALRAGRGEVAQGLLTDALDQNLSAIARIEMEDALALAEELQNRPGEALAASLRAHQLRAQTPGTVIPVQPRPDALAQYAGLQSRERFERWPEEAPDDGRPQPVFVFALPGSGVAQLAHVFKAHPDLRVLTDRFQPGFERQDVFTAEHAFTSFDDVDESQIRMQRRHYWRAISRTGENDSDSRRVIDVLPAEHALLDVAYRYFPEARLIWLLRDPRAALIENVIGPHEGVLPSSHFLDPQTAASYLAALGHLFARFAETLPLAPLKLRYESFDDDPDGCLEPFLEALGVDPHAALVKTLSSIQAVSVPPRPFTEAASKRYRLYEETLADAFDSLTGSAAELRYD